MTGDRNNVNLKRIAIALGLTKQDVAGAAGVSNSRADGWLRSPGSRKSGSGSTTSATVGRYRTMADDEFDGFCAGLEAWLDDRET